MISSKEIGGRRFEKATLGGYKTDEVDQFLKEIAIDLAQMQKDKEDCEKKIDILADKVREYMKDEEVIKEALLGAQRQGHQVIDESQIVANKIIAEANERADRIISQTQTQLENEKIVLSNMQKEVSDFKSKLLTLYKSHLDLITTMPEADDPDAMIKAASKEPAQPVQEANEDNNSTDQQKHSYPFSTPSANSNESRYTDLKFGHNSK